MNAKQSELQQNNQILNFDFDEWAALYAKDPQAFEERRLQWCNQLIKSAPKSYQRRLNGLLFQINMEKRRSSNAMDSCLKLSRLMWDKFHQMRDEMHGLIPPSSSAFGKPASNHPKHDSRLNPFGDSAQVLEFSTCPAGK